MIELAGCSSLPIDSSITTAPVSNISPTTTMAIRFPKEDLPAFSAQQRLYFLPLPQGHGALRP